MEEEKEEINPNENYFHGRDNLSIIKTQFTHEQKELLQFCHLEPYYVFISSMWFPSLNDHFNVVRSSRKFRVNFERYRFNPIPVNKETIKLFPNLETLRIDHIGDELFLSNPKIIARIYLKPTDLETIQIAFLPSFVFFHHLSISGTVIVLIRLITPSPFTALVLFRS